MGVLSKSAVAEPMLPKETVAMPSLKGDVVVTGLMLSARLNLWAKDTATVSDWLEATVLDADGHQLFTKEQWEIHGTKHHMECLELFKVAKRLSGGDAEAIEKNS